MITFRTSAEITQDREIIVKLPPETPMGKAELVVTVSPQEEIPSPPGIVRRHFATMRSSDPQAADNERIDADLTRAYGNSSK